MVPDKAGAGGTSPGRTEEGGRSLVRTNAIPLLITMALLNGVRGTFAYHKLLPRPEGLPSLAESFGALERNPAESEKVAGKGEEGKAAGD